MAKSANPFRYFDSSPEVTRLVVMMYVRYAEAASRSRSQ
jgi:putative transposase